MPEYMVSNTAMYGQAIWMSHYENVESHGDEMTDVDWEFMEEVLFGFGEEIHTFTGYLFH